MVSSSNTTSDGWQDGGNDRSSWNILWSCLTTILAYTWTVLHLNVPARGTSNRQIFFRKIRWLIITALAPELVTSYAFGDYLHARRLLAELKKIGVAGPDWTLAHGFYLSMGALNLKTMDGWEIPFCSHSKSSDGWEVPSYNSTIIKLAFSKILVYPEITDQDVQDRNKADDFSKAFAVLQSTWFVFSSIARATRGLPICPLELSCMAYVVCTCVTYGFWWSKPKDINKALVIPCHFALADVPNDIQESIKSFDPLHPVRCH